jgi:hypothetical protein
MFAREPREPLTLGNMRENGVRSLFVSCWLCHHQAVLTSDLWPDHVPVPKSGPRMVCTRCDIIGADARPNWSEQPARESLTGMQWPPLADPSAWPEPRTTQASVAASPNLAASETSGPGDVAPGTRRAARS